MIRATFRDLNGSYTNIIPKCRESYDSKHALFNMAEYYKLVIVQPRSGIYLYQEIGQRCTMINTILKAIIGSFICFVFTYLSFNSLSPFMLSNRNDIRSILTKTLDIFEASSLIKLQIISSVLAAIASIVLCAMIISYLFTQFEEETLSHIRKFTLIMWIVLLVIDILLLLYSLAFLVIIIIFSIILVFALLGAATSGGSSRGGGPVHVRSHPRKGTFVRSYTRRRPRRF